MIHSKINPWFIPRSIHYSIKYLICYSIQDATHDSIQNPTHCPIQDPINDPSVMFWIFCPWSHNLMTQKVSFDFNPDLTLISRPTFPNGSVPWRNLLHFWHWSHLLCNARWRRSGWSSHLYFPKNDQMYISQIRYIWQHRKSRRSVYPSHQHSQREDLCISLVLVLDSG